MSYELEKLLTRYGLGNAAPVSYLGPTKGDLGANGAALTDAQLAEQKALYDKYLLDYRNRLETRPMYGPFDPIDRLYGPQYGQYSAPPKTPAVQPDVKKPPNGGNEPNLPPPPSGNTNPIVVGPTPPPADPYTPPTYPDEDPTPLGPPGGAEPSPIPDPVPPVTAPLPPVAEPIPPTGTVVVGDPTYTDPGSGEQLPVHIPPYTPPPVTGPEPIPPTGRVDVGEPTYTDPGSGEQLPVDISPPPYEPPYVAPPEQIPPNGTVAPGDPTYTDPNTGEQGYVDITPPGGGYGGGYYEPFPSYDSFLDYDSGGFGGGYSGGGGWLGQDPAPVMMMQRGGLVKHFAEGGINDLADAYGVGDSGLPTIMNPQLRDLMAQSDPAPMSVPNAPAPTAPVASPAQPPTAAPGQRLNLMGLIDRYGLVNGPGTDFDSQFSDARKVYKSEADKYNALLQAEMDRKHVPMSKAEMWFRLASAFGSPTRTGSFWESLGKAGDASADMLKEQRQADNADILARRQLGIQAQGFKMNQAQQDVNAMRLMSTEQMKEKAGIVKELVKHTLELQDPKSEAGKEAKDMGLVPGTPEYNKFVGDRAQQKSDAIESRINAATAGLSATQARLLLSQAEAERKAAAANRLSPGEIALKAKIGEDLASYQKSSQLVDQAMELSPQAFTKSLPDIASKTALWASGQSSHPKMVATERLENLMTQDALATLRAQFGGNPSEGERAVQLATKGLSATSVASRNAIFKQLKTLVDANVKRKQAELDAVSSGQYGMKTE